MKFAEESDKSLCNVQSKDCAFNKLQKGVRVFDNAGALLTITRNRKRRAEMLPTETQKKELEEVTPRELFGPAR